MSDLSFHVRFDLSDVVFDLYDIVFDFSMSGLTFLTFGFDSPDVGCDLYDIRFGFTEAALPCRKSKPTSRI